MKQREVLQKKIMESLAALTTPEQYEKMNRCFSEMSDIDFFQAVAEMGQASAKEVTYKDCLKASHQVLNAQGLTVRDTVLGTQSTEFMDEPTNAKLWESVCSSKPSDMVCLSGRQDREMIGLWRDRNKPGPCTIPSDLFFAGTVPLMDCIIHVDERDMDNKGTVCEYRVVIFENAMRRIPELPDDEKIVVGTIVITENGHSILIPIPVVKGFDAVLGTDLGYHNMPKRVRDLYSTIMTKGQLAEFMVELLQTWYGIQIALLHPTVRMVFRHPRTERVYDGFGNSGKSKKRRTCYIKKHIINQEELEDAKCGGTGHGYTRRTLVWYVIGHWRTLSSGKKIFVKPMWKGPLRDLKMNLDEREREIAQLHEGGAVHA